MDPSRMSLNHSNLRYIHIISSFFFNDTATTEIYTLSLHDALPILPQLGVPQSQSVGVMAETFAGSNLEALSMSAKVSAIDRKSTRLNSSHANISYAVFCLKKKKSNITIRY